MHSSIFLSIFFFSIITQFEHSNSYRILGVFPLRVKSHAIMFEALMKGLARKGHQVDIISPYPLKKPYANYTDIVHLRETSPALVNNLSYDKMMSLSTDVIHFVTVNGGNKICKEDFALPEIRNILDNPPNDPPYDLFITEYFVSNCFLMMAHRLNIPAIGVTTSLLYPWLNSIIGNPYSSAFVPNNFLEYTAPMNFQQRLWNTIMSVYHDHYYHYLTSHQDDILKEHFGNGSPTIKELQKNLALVLVNSHLSLNGAKPLTSAVVEVGGLHVEDNNAEMAQDIKNWIDKSESGFVYFTFGSMVLIESFPQETLGALYKSLEKIAPIRVLMKVVDMKKLPPGLPKNIHTFKWAPQYKILNHKNIKAFITHGGLMGTQEAIHCGVPMIGIPLFVDQFTNVDLYVKKKIALKMDSENLTEENLDFALNQILFNPTYTNEAKKLSKMFRDRPMTSMDTAIWWIEYIGRHGSQALKSPALDLSWWQSELIDVYLFIFLITAFFIYLVILFLRFFIKLFNSREQVESAKKLN